MALLLDREWEVEGTWYAPQKFLSENYTTVVRSELWNTSSSAGDWDGYFVQRQGSRYYLIIFWQENMACTPYFRLHTGERPIASFKYEPTKELCEMIMENLCNLMAA